MKKSTFFAKARYLPLIALLTFGCCVKNHNKADLVKKMNQSEKDLGLNRTMVALSDSFMMELKNYESNNINLVGYIKVLESKDNKKFKVCFQGIHSEELFKKMTVNDYFLKEGFYFCIDYNSSNLFKSKVVSKKEIIKSSRIGEYRDPDTRIPAWLVEITNDAVTRINKKASSIFEPKVGVAYVTPKGVVSYDLTEWGEVVDSNGNIIDHFHVK